MQPSPLFDFIAKQNLYGSTDVNFLKKVIKQHPYFTPAQFFLLQHMPETDEAYPLQAAKTTILFNNPHWLHFQLHPGKIADASATEITAIAPAENTDNDDDAVLLTETSAPASQMFTETTTADKDEAAINNTGELPQLQEQITLAENTDNDDDDAVPLTETPAPATQMFTETTTADKDEAAINNTGELPQLQEQITLAENTDNDDDEVVITTEKEPLTEEQLMLAENPDDNDDITIQEEEIAPIKITMPNMENNPANENALTFEPMHMVDYFASQGIKLSDEVQAADKLGKQLKSFTEWLKTMKKIHVTDTEANAGISDIAIQALAAKSNKEGEIVTEAMAEVLLQQGKAGKAIEVYKKLSLLNPAKSAFFAAKIEQLKGS